MRGTIHNELTVNDVGERRYTYMYLHVCVSRTHVRVRLFIHRKIVVIMTSPLK